MFTQNYVLIDLILVKNGMKNKNKFGNENYNTYACILFRMLMGRITQN